MIRSRSPFICQDIHKFQIAGVTFALKLEGIDFPKGPSPFYTPFRTQLPADIKIQIRRIKRLPKRLSNKQLLFNGDIHWQLFQEKDNFRIELFDPKTKKRDRVAIISLDFSKVELFVYKMRWDVQILLKPLTEILIMNYLAPRQGLLIHAAAVRDHDKGYLFVGKSGAGKTTTSRFWRSKEGDYSLLGDERAIVRRIGGEWFLYGTPWPGDGLVVENKFSPLSHVFLIEHGKKNEILEASPIHLFQDVFGQVFSNFWNKELLTQITDTCGQLIQEVPCHIFPFVKTPEVTDFVSEFARKRAADEASLLQ